MVVIHKDIMDKNKAFGILKPVCDKFIKEPSKEHCAELIARLHSISPDLLQELQTYVLFPLELHLKRPDLSKEVKRHIIDSLKELILCTQIEELTLFLRLYNLLFSQIFDGSQENMMADTPEELKLSVVECASKLIHQTTITVIQQLYKNTHAPKLSQGIYICVQIMQNEKLRSLRSAAIIFIMTVAQVHDGSKVISSAVRHEVAEMLKFVLPGILSGLHKVAVGDEKQGHFVTFMAIRAWSRILVLMIEDGAMPKKVPPAKFRIVAKVSEPSLQSVESSHGHMYADSQEDLVKVLENQTRCPLWVADVVQKVAILLESFTVLQQHPHWKVRLELATSYHLLLDKCLQNLKPVTMTIIDVLLKLSNDPMEQVSYQSNKAIELLSKQLEEETETSLLEILEENFFTLVTRLPRILHGTDDGEKLAELRLLGMYLQLLGPHKLPHMLSSASHLQRLVFTLIQVVELDTATVSLLEDCSLKDFNQKTNVGLSRPWKQFKHFMSLDIPLIIQTICHHLGNFGDVDILSDCLLDILLSDSSHCCEVVLILNEILSGGSSDKCEHTVKNVLDIYLESSLWYVSLSVQGDNVTVRQAQKNVVFTCLLVEGIGKMANMLGPNFNQFLLRTLYMVAERAGSPHQMVALAGTMAAEEIAKAVRHGDNVASLLTANMDYFSFHATMKLRKLDQNPGVLDVLSLAMRHCNKDILPSLQNIVDNVLLPCFDTFQDQHALSFLQLFYTFFVSIRRWLGDEDHRNQSSGLSGISLNVVDTLVEYHETKRLSEWRDDGVNVDSDPVNDNELIADLEEEDKPNVPNYVTMTEAIMKRCLHFLPTKDKQCKLLAMETLQEGLHVLANWEEQLLPVVHLIWSPLIGRFEDYKDPLILNRSFLLVHALASVAKDFIRSRTLQNILPHICQFLSNSAKESKSKDSVPAYRFTQTYKLQYELLDKLGNLAVDLQFQEKELYQVLNVCSAYLSQLQPAPLQKCCLKLFLTIATNDQDCVWLAAANKLSQVSENSEFQQNAELLLQCVQSKNAVFPAK